LWIIPTNPWRRLKMPLGISVRVWRLRRRRMGDGGWVGMLFGSYLGETFRRHHGGEWGVCMDMPALRFGEGNICFPWQRVLKRLRNGEEDSVYIWYMAMVRLITNGSAEGEGVKLTVRTLEATPPPRRKSLLSRLFGK
jgi:hypothetical protein